MAPPSLRRQRARAGTNAWLSLKYLLRKATKAEEAFLVRASLQFAHVPNNLDARPLELVTVIRKQIETKVGRSSQGGAYEIENNSRGLRSAR